MLNWYQTNNMNAILLYVQFEIKFSDFFDTYIYIYIHIHLYIHIRDIYVYKISYIFYTHDILYTSVSNNKIIDIK